MAPACPIIALGQIGQYNPGSQQREPGTGPTGGSREGNYSIIRIARNSLKDHKVFHKVLLRGRQRRKTTKEVKRLIKGKKEGARMLRTVIRSHPPYPPKRGAGQRRTGRPRSPSSEREEEEEEEGEEEENTRREEDGEEEEEEEEEE